MNAVTSDEFECLLASLPCRRCMGVLYGVLMGGYGCDLMRGPCVWTSLLRAALMAEIT